MLLYFLKIFMLLMFFFGASNVLYPAVSEAYHKGVKVSQGAKVSVSLKKYIDVKIPQRRVRYFLIPERQISFSDINKKLDD